MSTTTKYSFAFGLLIAGVVAALPFRKTNSSDATPEVAMASAEAEQADSNSESDTPPKREAQVAKHPGSAHSFDRNLLPNQDQVDADLVEDPKRLTQRREVKKPPRFQQPERKEIGSTTDSLFQPLDLEPVEFSNSQPNTVMPENVGPYQMKPVNSPRVLSASQSRTRSSTGLISGNFRRNVIHYKLRDGDSLRSIAERYLGDENRFKEILRDNRHVLTNGENFLPIGEFITIIQ